jgi:SpoVK/Ycf46/Vps4 family AAA+-type ATPase
MDDTNNSDDSEFPDPERIRSTRSTSNPDDGSKPRKNTNRKPTTRSDTGSLPIVLMLERAIRATVASVNESRTKPRNVKGNKKGKGITPMFLQIPNNALSTPPIRPANLDELIELSKTCQRRSYRDCQTLGKLHGPLTELRNMIGLHKVKQNIMEFVLMRLQRDNIVSPSMSHILLSGPPGCGKTTLAGIVAKIICRLGMTKTETVVFGTQSNMIAGYLGQTAPKTEAVIRSAFGGVLVIDEASSLSDGRTDQNSDSFSKSCIDTLNRMLSEDGDKFLCILAGYRHELHRDILAVNPGMNRRFSTRFDIDGYTGSELREIVMRKVHARGMRPESDQTIPKSKWFNDHMLHFKHFGGDCEILVDKMTLAKSLRCFGSVEKCVLTHGDFLNGFGSMVKQYEHDEDRTREERSSMLYT